MKQTINLLPIKQAEKFDWLSFNSVSILLFLFLFFCTATAIWLGWSNIDTSQSLRFQVMKNQQEKSKLEQLSLRHTQRSMPADLSAKKLQLEQQVAAMEQMSQLLEAHGVNQSQGFSNTLQNVRRSAQSGMTFQQFSLGADQRLLSLTGTSKSAHQLPMLLANLRQYSVLMPDHMIRLSSKQVAGEQQFELLDNQGGVQQ